MADKNRQKEVYIFVLSLQSNGQNFNSTKTCVNSVEFPGYSRHLHDFRSYLASLCLSSPSFLLPFRQHIADSKILIISVIVTVIGVEQGIWEWWLTPGPYAKSWPVQEWNPSPVKVGGFLVSLPACCATLIGRRKGPYRFKCFWNSLQDWLAYVHILTPTNKLI